MRHAILVERVPIGQWFFISQVSRAGPMRPISFPRCVVMSVKITQVHVDCCNISLLRSVVLEMTSLFDQTERKPDTQPAKTPDLGSSRLADQFHVSYEG